jgi:Tfp pilus assembly PilM family ATPase/Tfp pilus assembly protein PilN
MKLSFLPAVKANDILGVCVTQDSARIVHLRVTPYKREVAGICQVNIAGLKDAEAAQALRLAWEGLRVRQAQTIAVISAHETITKNIEIPSNDPDEIREIINLQAGRHTPYSREEIVADYVNLGAFKNNYSKILLVIVARALVKQRVDLLERSGLRVSQVLFGAEAISQTSSRLCKADPNANAPTVIADVDEHHTDCIISHRGKALFVRTIPLGAAEVFGEKEKYFQKFCDELKVSLEAYQNEDIEKKPITLIMTGASDDQKDIASALEERLSLSAKTVPYARALPLSPEAQKYLSAHQRSSYLSVMASLYAAGDCLVDFTPDEIRVRRAVEQRGKDLIKTGIFVLVLFVLVSSLVVSRLYFKSSYLNTLEARKATLALQVRELDADVQKVTFIKNYLRRRGQALDVLTELYAVAPQELQLNDIRFESDKFTVRGTADSMSTVFSFAENLERSKLFKEVKTKNTMKRKENEKDVTDFEIGSTIEASAR